MLQLKGLLTWVRKDKQICMHTYTRKTISGYQVGTHSWPMAGCGHAPGLKKHFLNISLLILCLKVHLHIM